MVRDEMNPQERLSNAYAARNPDAKRLRGLAAGFQRNEFFTSGWQMIQTFAPK
jgi:hypothetical protein